MNNDMYHYVPYRIPALDRDLIQGSGEKRQGRRADQDLINNAYLGLRPVLRRRVGINEQSRYFWLTNCGGMGPTVTG